MLNVAVVAAALELVKVTVPGPLTLLQTTVSVLPAGRPSSLTTPLKFAGLGKPIVWFVPALTEGAWLAGLTVMVTVAVFDSAESLAVRLKT